MSAVRWAMDRDDFAGDGDEGTGSGNGLGGFASWRGLLPDGWRWVGVVEGMFWLENKVVGLLEMHET